MIEVVVQLPEITGPRTDLALIVADALVPFGGRMPVGADLVLDARATWYADPSTIVTLVTHLRRGDPRSIEVRGGTEAARASIIPATR